KLHRRLLPFVADPCGTERFRQLSVRFTSRGNINFALPRMQHINRQVRRRSKTKQADALSLFDSSHPQSAESDDSSTQQWSCVQIIQLRWNREAEIRPCQRVLGISPVD